MERSNQRTLQTEIAGVKMVTKKFPVDVHVSVLQLVSSASTNIKSLMSQASSETGSQKTIIINALVKVSGQLKGFMSRLKSYESRGSAMDEDTCRDEQQDEPLRQQQHMQREHKLQQRQQIVQLAQSVQEISEMMKDLDSMIVQQVINLACCLLIFVELYRAPCWIALITTLNKPSVMLIKAQRSWLQRSKAPRKCIRANASRLSCL